MVSVLASCAVYCGFETRSGQTKYYKIGICCFSSKHAALRSKSKDWLARNQNNVSEWSDMSTHGLLFQLASTLKIQLSVCLEQSGDHHHFIDINLF
jgi:outer membrane protease